jgi:hypothetical protein
MSRRINPHKKFNCSLIPEWLECRSSKEISDGAKLVYARLSRFAGEDGVCYPKLELLALKVGKSLAQVKRCVKELKDLKLIESVQVGKKCSNRYYFLDHEWMHLGVFIECDSSHMTLHIDDGQNCVSSHMTLPMDSSHMTLPQKENQERESNIHHSVFSKSDRWKKFAQLFEGKSKTGDCDQKLNKLSEEDFKFLLAQRDAYFDFVKSKRKEWDAYPMKNAVTFLNPKYWKKAEWKNEESKNKKTVSLYDF